MRTRFAPSPTGRLHLGHALSALTAWDMAVASGGEFILRIEDLDATRCRDDFIPPMLADLAWLGLRWPEPVMRQSDRTDAYAAALDRLRALGVLYPCTCTRRDIALAAPQEGVLASVYPGTCRGRTDAPPGAALRLDIARALALTGPVTFVETGPAHAGRITPDPRALGDPVLARRDIGTSYHLAVVLDDATQAVTHVTRGTDLLDSTGLHILLQTLLKLPSPVYHHHRLMRDADGRRLAKRHDALALSSLRAECATPADIRRLTGL